MGEGFDILQKINEIYVDDNKKPLVNIRILHSVILDDPFEDPEDFEIPDSPARVRDKKRLEYDEKEEFM